MWTLCDFKAKDLCDLKFHKLPRSCLCVFCRAFPSIPSCFHDSCGPDGQLDSLKIVRLRVIALISEVKMNEAFFMNSMIKCGHLSSTNSMFPFVVISSNASTFFFEVF